MISTSETARQSPIGDQHSGSSDSIPFHTYLWKIASRCNLNCTYCYVYNSADSGWRRQPKFMSERTARQSARRILQHLETHDKKDVAINFHGGEPLMGGLDHLQMLARVIGETFAGTGVQVSVGMQSNLLEFSPEIGQLMLELGMSIGVSLDGPPAINDIYRVDHQSRPSSRQLEQKLELLTSERFRPVFSGFLCVINPETDPVEVIDYLLSWNPIGIDFLFPLDNHDRRPPGKESDLAAAPYGEWLVGAYDRWIATPSQAKVRIFNSIIRMLCGGDTYVESLGLLPVDLVVIETNGEIEAVDSLKSAFEGATQLGYNVFEHDFDRVARDVQVRTRQLGAASLSATCQECGIVRVCGGGYVPHRYSAHRLFDNPSVYCSDLTRIITHIHSTLIRELRSAGVESVP